jgi:hypothetical protein
MIEKFSVTIDNGQKPGHFRKIKKSLPHDITLKPGKHDMSRNRRMYGNPKIHTG